MQARSQLYILIALSGVLFLTNLGGYDLWPPDEPRFAEVAREMRETGDYLVPRVNGVPYNEKPPLLFWSQAALAVPFGGVTEWPARLPSALSGVLAVVMTYLLVARLYGNRTAFWAGLILTTTQRFWWQTRFGQIDMLLAACVTASFLFFWLWHKDRQRLHLVGFYLAIAAGVFSKGPPALIFPLFMVVAFYWKRKEDRKQLHLVLGFLVVGILFSLWLVPARMAVSAESSITMGGDMSSNLFRQTIGRFFLGVAHAKPPWYYLLQLPVDLFPWSVFLPWTLWWTWRNRKSSEEIAFLLSWIVPAFIFFSVCSGKRALYLLPLYPAFAALFAISILDLVDGPRIVWRKRTACAWGIILMMLAMGPFAMLLTEFNVHWNNTLRFLSACAFLGGLFSIGVAWRSESRSLPTLMVVQYSMLLICVAVVGFPFMNVHKSAKQFCEPLRQLSRGNVEYDLYSFAFAREEYIYYSEHFHQSVPNALLDVAGLETLSESEHAVFQANELRAIQKAVKSVQIESVSTIGETELKLLQDAVEATAVDSEYTRPFKVAIATSLNEFIESVSTDKPAFIVVQEEDWKWVLGLCPDARRLHLVKDDYVGSRHVLLLGNAAGAQLINIGSEGPSSARAT